MLLIEVTSHRLCSGRDLQVRFLSGARGEREAEPEEGGAAGPADSGPG